MTQMTLSSGGISAIFAGKFMPWKKTSVDIEVGSSPRLFLTTSVYRGLLMSTVVKM